MPDYFDHYAECVAYFERNMDQVVLAWNTWETHPYGALFRRFDPDAVPQQWTEFLLNDPRVPKDEHSIKREDLHALAEVQRYICLTMESMDDSRRRSARQRELYEQQQAELFKRKR